MKRIFLCTIIFILNSVSFALTPLDHNCPSDSVISEPPETAYVDSQYIYDVNLLNDNTAAVIVKSPIGMLRYKGDIIKWLPTIDDTGLHAVELGLLGNGCLMDGQKYTITVINNPITRLKKDKVITDLVTFNVNRIAKRGQIIFEIEVNKRQSIFIDIFDLSGKRLISSYSQIFDVGKGHISISPQLKSGVYILGLNGKNFTRKIKFITFY